MKINTDKKLISADPRKPATDPSCHARAGGHPINRVRFSNWIPLFRGMTIILPIILYSLFFILVPTVQAATVTWDGGASGGWNTATNWSNDIVPTSSDDVTIDNAAVTTSSNISFSTLTIGSGSSTTSLTLTNNITSGGSITISNAGTLTQNNKVQQVTLQ